MHSVHVHYYIYIDMLSFYAIVVAEYLLFPFSSAVEHGVMNTHGGRVCTSSVSGSDEDETDPGYPSQKDVSHFPGNFLLRGVQGRAAEGFDMWDVKDKPGQRGSFGQGLLYQVTSFKHISY